MPRGVQVSGSPSRTSPSPYIWKTLPVRSKVTFQGFGVMLCHSGSMRPVRGFIR